MTAPAAPPPVFALDACAALRADTSAQDAAPTAAAADSAGPWLVLVTSLERAAQLAPAQRPAHFRRARLVWDGAADALGNPRYATAGARLARWRAADPTLPLVKELLWAVEQPEAAGYTHLALAGYDALGRLLPPDDVRRGYVLAQSARAVRTLGDLDNARERYEASEQLAVRHRDPWLRVRSAVGLGATLHQVGNHAGARAVFERILRTGSPDPRFTAVAHHGLVLGAIAAEDWDLALHHGWHLLRAGRSGLVPRIDVLLLMAGVCHRTGRHRAAVSAAEAALKLCVRPDDGMLAHKIMADTGLSAGDRTLALRHARALRPLLRTGAGPYDQARCLHTLGLVEERWGVRARAAADLQAALDLAVKHRFHELVFTFEPDHLRLHTALAARGAERPPCEPADAVNVPLSAQSERIVERLSAVASDAPSLLAVAG